MMSEHPSSKHRHSEHPLLAVVILAAGKGTRMKSDLPKVMHPLAGKPMISLLIDQVSAHLNPERIIVVTAPEQENLRDLVHPHHSVIQEKQLGTGDAARAALPALEGFEGNVLILLGDEPFLPLEAAAEMAVHDTPSVMAIIPPDPTGLGRIVMDENGQLIRIVEEKDCSAEDAEICICNGGNFCVPADMLGRWLNGIGNNNAQSEYYLTDIPELARAEGINFDVFTVPIDHVWGVNDRMQLAEHEKMFQQMLRDMHLMNGVAMQDPDSVYFHYDTVIGTSCNLEPNVYFGPGVKIGNNVEIKSFCHLEGASVADGSVIGPFARLRPGSDLGEGVKIGNFVEIKKSSIGAGSKINHLSYVGDCTMGEKVNFSAGAITVNYDGFQKYQTKIGANALIGSNANLVAPITVGDGAYIAAGSTVTKDIPGGALGIAREREKIKEEWASDFVKKNKTS